MKKEKDAKGKKDTEGKTQKREKAQKGTAQNEKCVKGKKGKMEDV